MKKKDLLTIYEFAQICRTTPRTVRFYEEKGLFAPYSVDGKTKYRYYKKEQARDFLKIKLLQHFKMPLYRVKQLRETTNIEKSLESELARIQAALAEGQKELAFLRQIKTFLFNEKKVLDMMTTETFGPYTLFCHYVDPADYDQINTYRQELFNTAKSVGLQHKNTDMCFYDTMQYMPKGTKVELALICNEINLSAIAHLDSTFYYRTFPRTTCLVYTSTGPYDYFILVYTKLDRYMLRHGMKLVGKVFDLYEKSFFNTKSPYDYVHKLCYPTSIIS